MLNTGGSRRAHRPAPFRTSPRLVAISAKLASSLMRLGVSADMHLFSPQETPAAANHSALIESIVLAGNTGTTRGRRSAPPLG